jgi:preprotein translocase SecE subunit
MKTPAPQAVLIPPPPKPPIRTATAGASPDPRRRLSSSRLYPENSRTFLAEVYGELTQMVWPSRATSATYTVLTVATIILFSAIAFFTNGATSLLSRALGIE